jgi:hypothetical protein
LSRWSGVDNGNVPGEGLHDIIRVVMGWFDYHLWEFTISDDTERLKEDAADLRAWMELHIYLELARAKTATGPQVTLPNVPLTTKVGSAAAAWPLAAEARQLAMPAVGFLHASSHTYNPQLVAAFREGLKETGYVEGRTSPSNIDGARITLIVCQHSPPTWYADRSRARRSGSSAAAQWASAVKHRSVTDKFERRGCASKALPHARVMSSDVLRCNDIANTIAINPSSHWRFK